MQVQIKALKIFTSQDIMTVLRLRNVISNDVTLMDMIKRFQLVIQINTITDILRVIKMDGIKRVEVLEETVSNQHIMEQATSMLLLRKVSRFQIIMLSVTQHINSVL